MTAEPAATRPNLLETSGISKRFGGIIALDDVHFGARAGEVHAILGENGAGKSTFIQILGGSLQPDGGEMRLDGSRLRPRNPREAQLAGVSCVYQELSLIPDLSVAENVWFGVEQRTVLGTIARRRMNERTRALFADLGLPRLNPAAPVRSLSIGEQQIVEIVKSVARDPRVIVLDEATSALAPAEVDWLLGTARRLADAGTVVLYISHRLAEVRRVADRVTVLRNGRTVGTHPTRDLSDADIVTMMLGRRLTNLYPPRLRPAAAPADLLTVRDLSVGHQLDRVSFTLAAGEVLGVAGLQGHGQRELFLALAGIVPYEGDVAVRGHSVTLRSPRQAMASPLGIALLPEDRRTEGIMLTKSVRHNLTLSALPAISRRGVIDAKAETALTQDLVTRLQIKVQSTEQLAGTLSGGNQQKVALGKLLAAGASILLLLDPTRGVDVGTKAEIFALMRQLCGQGFGILFYSTDLAELAHVADRCLVLSYGHIAAELTGDDLAEDQILHATMKGRAS